MNLSKLRVLAGLPIKEEAESFHFGLENEASVAKVCIALAKEGLTVDMEYAMDVFYFNFKNSKAKEKAKALAKSFIGNEQIQEGIKKC